MEIDIYMDHQKHILWGVQLYMAILKMVSRHLGLPMSPPLLLSLLDGGNVYSLKGSFKLILHVSSKPSKTWNTLWWTNIAMENGHL